MTGAEPVSRLERRYRRLLRLLPAYYRAAWEQDMVATFLATKEPDDPDDAPIVAEYGSPSFAEVRSVLALAVRLRLGVPGGPAKYLVTGAAVRLIGLLGLLFLAVTALTDLLFWLPTAWRLNNIESAALVRLLALAWVPAFCCVLFGRRGLGVAFAVLGLLSAVIRTVVHTVQLGVVDLFMASNGYRLLVEGIIVAALVAFHREAPSIRPRPWLLALSLVALLTGAIRYGGFLVVGFGAADIGGVLLVLTGLTFLLTPRLPWRRDPVPWAGALGVLALLQVGELTLHGLSWTNTEETWLATAYFVQAGVLVLLVVGVRVFARTQFNRGHSGVT